MNPQSSAPKADAIAKLRYTPIDEILIYSFLRVIYLCRHHSTLVIPFGIVIWVAVCISNPWFCFGTISCLPIKRPGSCSVRTLNLRFWWSIKESNLCLDCVKVPFYHYTNRPKLAEGEGIEPPLVLPRLGFSKPAYYHSSNLPKKELKRLRIQTTS